MTFSFMPSSNQQAVHRNCPPSHYGAIGYCGFSTIPLMPTIPLDRSRKMESNCAEYIVKWHLFIILTKSVAAIATVENIYFLYIALK